MAFNPLDQKGLPIDQQFRSWSDLAVSPYDKRAVDPYTRTRVILMNGTEVESIMFSPADELPDDHRFFAYQDIVNAGHVPSEQVSTRTAR